MFIWRGKYDLFFRTRDFFFVFLFEIYTSFLVKGFYAINRCVAMEAFFLGWNSLSTFGNVFWVLFLYFVRASSLFWERNAYWVVRKIQRQFNNVRIVCFGGFYVFIGFVLFPLRILLVLFSFREFLCVVFPVYYKLQNFYNITFDKQNFQNIYSRN